MPNIDTSNKKLKKSVSLINNNFLSNRNKLDYNYFLDKKKYFFIKTGYFSPQNVSMNLFQINNNFNFNISNIKKCGSTINLKKII